MNPNLSPLGVNIINGLMTGTGLGINALVTKYLGTSSDDATYSPGDLVNLTCLKDLTNAINLAFTKNLSQTTLNNLISIGKDVCPALGNSKPATFIPEDPTNRWTTEAQEALGRAAPANTGSTITGTTNRGQSASWFPYDASNNTSQWGYLRLHALQAYNELHWNDSQDLTDFCYSLDVADGWIKQSNPLIYANINASGFMQGSFSNLDDMISGDISGVSLAFQDFGQDLINLGKIIDLSRIGFFGLPSSLLYVLGKNKAVSDDLNLAFLAFEVPYQDLEDIVNGKMLRPSKATEQKIYQAFQIITGDDLIQIIGSLGVKTEFDTLADLLDVKKLFPNSYRSLTVPLYNLESSPNGAKTYYPLFSESGINSSLKTQVVKEYVGHHSAPGAMQPNEEASDPANFSALPLGFGGYLQDISPEDLQITAGAFSWSMRQITGIEKINFEKFARTIVGLESNIGLGLLTLPPEASNNALGSGPYGTYTLSDLFGSVTGLPYPWRLILQALQQLPVKDLANLYGDLLAELQKVSPDEGLVNDIITQANDEINNISENNDLVKLNTYWDILGLQLKREQRARYHCFNPVAIPRDYYLTTSPNVYYNFVDELVRFAEDMTPHSGGQSFEMMADLTTLAGQSIIGLMRQVRNVKRGGLLGLKMTEIAKDLSKLEKKRLIVNGVIENASEGLENDKGTYTLPAWAETLNANGEIVMPNPVGIFGDRFLKGSGVKEGDIDDILNNVDNPQVMSMVSVGPFEDIVKPNPIPILAVPEDYNPNNLPIELNTLYTASIALTSVASVDDAVKQVADCNCTCWL
jgi:hypothetical protein